MIDTRESLYALLPAYVRQRDLQTGGALRELVGIIADQVILLERDLAHMYDSWFIETCDAWAIPYIADLLGLASSAAIDAAAGTGASTPRREVANLIAYRRRKGTAALLDDVAADASGWPALGVESYRRLVAAQHLDHVHARRLATPDLRAARLLGRIDLPFDTTCHLGDVRRMNGVDSPGSYDPSGLAMFVFRTQAFTVTSTTAYCCERVGDHCYTFSVLGNDAPIYRYAATVADACASHVARQGPARPLSRLELEKDASPDAASASVDPDLYGPGRSFAIVAPEWPRKAAGEDEAACIAADAIIPADLTEWSYRVPRNKVAVDPVLGRIMFPVAQAPQHGVQVDYAYGFAMALGGGEYVRPMLATPARVSRRRVRAIDADPPQPPEFASIEAAIADWRKQRDAQAASAADQARPTALPALVVELADSGLYLGALDIKLQTGESAWIVAAPDTRPVLWLSDARAGAPDAISISGGRGSRVGFDGVLIAGRGLSISATHRPGANEGGEGDGSVDDPCEVVIRHCTLVPGGDLEHDCEPRLPADPSIVLNGSRACLRIDHSIVGAIRVNVDADGPPARVHVGDSIVDATSQTRTAIGAPGDAIAYAHVDVRRSTVVGAVLVHAIERADDSLFVGNVAVARRQTGCMRYCYVPADSRTPRRYRCQPDGAIAEAIASTPAAALDRDARSRVAADAILRTTPRFAAMRYGRPDYLRLTACTSPAISRGADDGSEMGVYHDLFEPQRVDRLQASLDDYAPADVDAAVLFAS